MPNVTVRKKIIDRAEFTLTAGTLVNRGDTLCLDPATGKLVAVSASTTIIPLGYATRFVSPAAAVDVSMTVEFFEEIVCTSRQNSLTNPVARAGAKVYAESAKFVCDQTTQPLLGIAIVLESANSVSNVFFAPIHAAGGAGAIYSSGTGLTLECEHIRCRLRRHRWQSHAR
jgi:hypothetical protein